MLKCFDCQFIGDILALYVVLYGDKDPDGKAIVNRPKAIKRVLSDFADKLDTLPAITFQTQPTRRRDYSAYIRQCTQNLTPDCDGWQYLRSRGFSDFDISVLRNQYSVGYDGECTGSGSLEKSVRAVVMGYSDGFYYRARSTGDKLFTSPKGSSPGVYQVEQLDKADFCFVVESEIDCLSIIIAARYSRYSVGCVSTGGAANTGPLLARLKEKLIKGRLIILFDADDAGHDGTIRLQAMIPDGIKADFIDTRLLMMCYRDRDGSGLKDPNDILKWHGPRILAGAIDGVISCPSRFSF